MCKMIFKLKMPSHLKTIKLVLILLNSITSFTCYEYMVFLNDNKQYPNKDNIATKLRQLHVHLVLNKILESENGSFDDFVMNFYF